MILAELLRSLNCDLILPKEAQPKNYRQSRSRCLDDNHQPSIQIISSMQQLISQASSSSVKSFVYEALYSVIKSAPRLIDAICGIFQRQIDPCVVPTEYQGFHFDLSKCLGMTTNESGAHRLTATEPVDVLFHYSFLCTHELSKSSLKAFVAGFKSVSRLKTIVNGVFNFYQRNEPKTVYEVYKTQLVKKIRTKSSQLLPAASFKTIHQIELGIYDVVVEMVIRRLQFG